MMESFPIPTTLLHEEILRRLDLQSLCSLACVNKLLRSVVVSAALPSVSSFDVPTLYPDAVTLQHILRRCLGFRRVSLSCNNLPESALLSLLSPSLVELNLHACHFIPISLMVSISQSCPDLSVLNIEFTTMFEVIRLQHPIQQLIEHCKRLESLCLRMISIKTQDVPHIICFLDIMPKTIKVLKVEPVLESEVFYGLLSGVSPSPPVYQLQSLSLVLSCISDRVLNQIADVYPMLVDLELEDKPYDKVLQSHDLTNVGLQALGRLQQLRGLSLTRRRQNISGSFKRITDMGIFMLSEGCKGLETVRLCGFSKVTDAGYASILHSCKKLKKFEVRDASKLSDLAFHELNGDQFGLLEVRLSSANLISSESVKKLATSRSLEVLHLVGCKSVDDNCLGMLSCLPNLTALNLIGADITDDGLLALSKLNSPIKLLCLRGCKRVTDRGIRNLLDGGGMISKKLVSLDLGYMPGISDEGILIIAIAGVEITELCIRYCFHVTDLSLKVLAVKKDARKGSKPLKRLDLYNCTGLSVKGRKILPLFGGLHWLGIGKTHLVKVGQKSGCGHYRDRPWLTICIDDCEIGCHDCWQYHRAA